MCNNAIIKGKHKTHVKYKIADNINPELVEFEAYSKIFELGQFNNIFNYTKNYKKLNKFMNMEIKEDDLFNDRKLSDQLRLYDFINKVGVYTVYLFINILDPEKLSIMSGPIKSKDIKLTKKEKETLIQKWISNTIDINFIFKQFCRLEFVRRRLKLDYPITNSYENIQNTIREMRFNDLNEEDKERFKHDLSFRQDIEMEIGKSAKEQFEYFQNRNNLEDYDMIKTDHNYLVQIFKDVYPEIFERLEKRKEKKRKYWIKRKEIQQQLTQQEKNLEENKDDEHIKENIKSLRKELSNLRRNKIYYN